MSVWRWSQRLNFSLINHIYFVLANRSSWTLLNRRYQILWAIILKNYEDMRHNFKYRCLVCNFNSNQLPQNINKLYYNHWTTTHQICGNSEKTLHELHLRQYRDKRSFTIWSFSPIDYTSYSHSNISISKMNVLKLPIRLK